MIKIALLQSRNILSFEGGRTERTGVLVLHERADGLWNAWPQGSNTASSCGSNAQRQTVRAGFRAPEGQLARGHPRQTTHRTGRDDVLRRDLLVKPACPVVVITCVRYLGPPGPSPSQILGTFSRFSEDCLWQRPYQGGALRLRGAPKLVTPSPCSFTEMKVRSISKMCANGSAAGSASAT